MPEEIQQLIKTQISDPDTLKAIFEGNPTPFELDGVQAVNFWFYGQEIDLYLIEPIAFKHVEIGAFFDTFDDLLQEITL